MWRVRVDSENHCSYQWKTGKRMKGNKNWFGVEDVAISSKLHNGSWLGTDVGYTGVRLWVGWGGVDKWELPLAKVWLIIIPPIKDLLVVITFELCHAYLSLKIIFVPMPCYYSNYAFFTIIYFNLLQIATTFNMF